MNKDQSRELSDLELEEYTAGKQAPPVINNNKTKDQFRFLSFAQKGAKGAGGCAGGTCSA